MACCGGPQKNKATAAAPVSSDIGDWKLGDLHSDSALRDVPGSAACPLVPALNVEPFEVTDSILCRYDLAEDGRVVVVGDTHGCLDEFLQLLKQQDVDPAKNDVVIIIGDVVNKGPKSAELLRYVIANEHVLAIRGNHEDGALLAVAEKAAGKETKPEWDWVEQLNDAEVAFLRSMPLVMTLPKFDVVLVHAGLLPHLPLHEQPHVIQTKLRIYVKDPATGHPDKWIPHESNWKERADKVPWAEVVPWWKLWKQREHVIFGHDARKGLQLAPWATGLDTGCYTKDAAARLTAMVLGPKVPSAETLARRRKEGCRPDEGLLDMPSDRPGTLVAVMKIGTRKAVGK
jgi:bis(5'-nucleosyl)-tetraphosphatase (symmetrical)